MEKEELRSLLKTAFPFFERLTDKDREAMLSGTSEVSFGKGENVHDGSRCTGVILPRRGSLRIYFLSEDGKEVTLYRLFPGDMCMLSASCVLNSITFDVFVDAEGDCQCAVVSGSVFAELSARYSEVKIFALEKALGRFSDVMWIMQQILFMSMDKRIAILLLDEVANQGTDRLHLTHEQIAKYVGTAREVVTRMLKYFASEGLVELSRGGVTVTDKPRLRSMTL